jgi:hypothetical protein
MPSQSPLKATPQSKNISRKKTPLKTSPGKSPVAATSPWGLEEEYEEDFNQGEEEEGDDDEGDEGDDDDEEIVVYDTYDQWENEIEMIHKEGKLLDEALARFEKYLPVVSSSEDKSVEGKLASVTLAALDRYERAVERDIPEDLIDDGDDEEMEEFEWDGSERKKSMSRSQKEELNEHDYEPASNLPQKDQEEEEDKEQDE